MNKWTINELNKTDDITFAMSILSERRAELNPNAPLAQKIVSTLITLEKIRGGCPVVEGDCWQIIRERIFQEVEREHTVGIIKSRLEDKTNENGECTYYLHGLTADKILADREITDSIVRRLEKCECSDDYWIALDFAIEQGVYDVTERRNGE